MGAQILELNKEQFRSILYGEHMNIEVLEKLKEETTMIRKIVKDYESLQRCMAEARNETTKCAVDLGLEENVSKNHPSVISYLTGYTKGRVEVLESLKQVYNIKEV